MDIHDECANLLKPANDDDSDNSDDSDHDGAFIAPDRGVSSDKCSGDDSIVGLALSVPLSMPSKLMKTCMRTRLSLIMSLESSGTSSQSLGGFLLGLAVGFIQKLVGTQNLIYR